MTNTAISTASQKPLSELYALWDKLGDVPTDENKDSVQVLDEPFLHFGVGTPCEDVWHWFEAQHPAFIAGEVMQGIRKSEVQH